MSNLQLECLIDGQSYSYRQIVQIEHHRNLHCLHEMKRLGADLSHSGESLSHDAIDLLGIKEARAVSVTVRKALGKAGLRQLFADQLRASDKMWKNISKASGNAPYKLCSADMTVSGISFDAFQDIIALENFQRRYAEINPDHFFLEVRENGIRSMEVFGMHGGPSEVYLNLDPTLEIPFERDPDFPTLVTGYTTLASDETPINIFVAHQYKPLADGVAMRLGCLFPAATPDEIVDGHKLHSAIEFWELMRPADADWPSHD